MTKLSRILIFLGAFFLASTFVAPLWQISIRAPQYPEGLSMQIWTHQITGDLRSINILNHYIGMKPIQASDFKEFVWFSRIFFGLIALGLIASLSGHRLVGYFWSTSLLGFSLWAFYDFWKWEYTFGHQLSRDAPIQVEGMTYAPPLIESKELLNITAASWPALGGWGVALADALAMASLGMELSGCFSPKAEPIFFGQDQCQSCKMTITDRRFGVEWVNAQGKVYKFDSLECFASFSKSHPIAQGHTYVTEMSGTGNLIPAEQAYFIFDDHLKSPMGIGFHASQTPERLRPPMEGRSPKSLMKWDEVLKALTRAPE